MSDGTRVEVTIRMDTYDQEGEQVERDTHHERLEVRGGRRASGTTYLTAIGFQNLMDRLVSVARTEAAKRTVSWVRVWAYSPTGLAIASVSIHEEAVT